MPGTEAFRRFGSSGIVVIEAVLDVAGAADVVTSCGNTAKNVDIKHQIVGVVELRPRLIGVTPYLPDVNRDALPDELQVDV